MFAVLRVEPGLTPGFASGVDRSVPGPCLIRVKSHPLLDREGVTYLICSVQIRNSHRGSHPNYRKSDPIGQGFRNLRL